MEAVSAAASIAGLLSVAGHVVNGVVKLNAIVQDMKDIDDRAKSLGKEVELLTRTLDELKSVLHTLEGCFVTRNRASWESNTATINSHLIQCCSEVEQWTVSIRSIRNPQSTRRKIIDMFQKRRQRELSNVEAKLESHRLQLGLDIGTLSM